MQIFHSLGPALSYLIQLEVLNWFPCDLSAGRNSLEVKAGFPLQVSPDVEIYPPIQQILRRTVKTVWVIFKQKSPQCNLYLNIKFYRQVHKIYNALAMILAEYAL